MRVRIFPQAETDIIRQFRYYLVNQEAPLVALRFRQSVMETAKRLTQTPGIGKPVEITLVGLRSWPVLGFKAIRLYYRQTPDSVDIVRLLHGKQNVRIILARKP